jgi:hypothetical protein
MIGGIFGPSRQIFNCGRVSTPDRACDPCRPSWKATDSREQWTWLGAGVAAAILIPGLAYRYIPDEWLYRTVLIGLIVASLLLWNRTLLYAAAIGLAFFASQIYQSESRNYQSLRSFFGVHKILHHRRPVPVLMHGTTTHGAQRSAMRRPPVTGRPENIGVLLRRVGYRR